MSTIEKKTFLDNLLKNKSLTGIKLFYDSKTGEWCIYKEDFSFVTKDINVIYSMVTCKD